MKDSTDNVYTKLVSIFKTHFNSLKIQDFCIDREGRKEEELETSFLKHES